MATKSAIPLLLFLQQHYGSQIILAVLAKTPSDIEIII